MHYPSQHFDGVGSSAYQARLITYKAHQMRKVHPAGSETQNSTAKTVYNNNNTEDMDDGANSDDNDDDNDDVVLRCSSSSSSSGGLYGARQCLIAEKDATGRRLLVPSAAWKNDETHNIDSEKSVDEHQMRDNEPLPQQENSSRDDDGIGCSCWNDVICTASEV